MLATPPLLMPPHELEMLFARLVAEWHRETDLLSNSTKASMHPAYQRIIGLGAQAIPLILREMQAQGGHWAWALRAITGENPAAQVEGGNIRAAREAWLAWGRERGYLSDR
jgi:hypothetical protein